MSAALSLPTLDGLPHGFHPNVSEAVYHAKRLDVASYSGLKIFGRSPLKYREWALGAGREDTDAFRLGRAVHCAMLEPARFERDYTIMPDFRENGEYRTKASRQRRDEWIAGRNGAPVLDEDTCAQVRGMVASVLAHPKARWLLEGGLSEVTLRWRDPETGVECRARIDHYNEELAVIADLKSCEDASADAFFGRDCPKLDYQLQDSFYERGAAALGRTSEFAFVCCEKAYPYEVAVHQLGERTLGEAHYEISRRLERFAHCIATNNWPGLPVAITKRELPWTKYGRRSAA